MKRNSEDVKDSFIMDFYSLAKKECDCPSDGDLPFYEAWLECKLALAVEALETIEEFSGFDKTLTKKHLQEASTVCCRQARSALNEIFDVTKCDTKTRKVKAK